MLVAACVELVDSSFGERGDRRRHGGRCREQRGTLGLVRVVSPRLLAATKVSCLSRAAALGAGAALGAMDGVVPRGGGPRDLRV